jgi:Ferritin-like domain
VSEPPRHRSATRRELLRAGAVAGAAALATPGLLPTVAAAASGPASSAPPGDAARLERVLSMAVLAAYVYQQVFAEGVLTQSQRRALDGFAEQEQAHVVALRRAVVAVGGTVIRPPTSLDVANGYLAHRGIGGRLGQLQGSDDALDLLVSVERSSIGSCYVALLGLTGSAAIMLVASIMANDAQHEAVVTLQRPNLTLADAAPFPLVSGVH